MNPAMEKLAAALTKTIGANSENQEVKDWLDMGFPPLNKAISGDDKHGLPLGRIVEVFGPSSSGKTWLATVAMINAQKQGGMAIFLDHERSFDAGMAEKLGLNLEFPYWIYKTPATWEESNVVMLQAAQLIRDSKVIPANAPIIAVTDSIAACIAKSAATKEIDEYNMNDTTALARATSTTLKNIKPRVQEFNMLALYLNQIRTKPGVLFGDPLTTPGGGAMEFFADARISTGRKLIREEKNGEKELVGQEIRIKVVKTKFCRPFSTCDVRLMFDEHGVPRFDVVGSAIDYLDEKKLFPKDGDYYLWDGKKLRRKALIETIIKDGKTDDILNMTKQSVS